MVSVTWLVQPMNKGSVVTSLNFRFSPILDANGNPMEKAGMLAFDTAPNPNADDGTEIGMFLEVTQSEGRPDDRHPL